MPARWTQDNWFAMSCWPWQLYLGEDRGKVMSDFFGIVIKFINSCTKYKTSQQLDFSGIMLRSNLFTSALRYKTNQQTDFWYCMR